LILTTVEGKSVTENPLDPCVRARCNAGVGQFTIGADGKVYPCPNCFDIPEFEAGDARKDELLEIWRNGNWGIFRSFWLTEDLHFCKKCKWIKQCRLGYVCRPPVYVATGDLFGPPPACLLDYRSLGFKKRDVVDYLRSAIERVPEGKNEYLRYLLRRTQKT
jgi:radical SAM protein with 4Fe4S-binding SPASM domain